jgi:WD40 repeat protein
MHRLLLCFSLLVFTGSVPSPSHAQTRPYDTRSLLVCGDSKIHLVDSSLSKDTTPHIVWTWDAHVIQDLPEEFRKRKFNSVDDVKAVRGGSQLLISSSSGAVALWDVEKNKTLFHATVPNAHSIELLPGGLLVAAASVHAEGNRLMLFDPPSGSSPVFTDELNSAHGVVWHEDRQTLFALGFDVLREYKLEGKTLKRVREWKIPGESGHDLMLSPDKKSFFVTEHTGAWRFDLAAEKFSKIEGFPDAENIKSLSMAVDGQYLYTVPEESWWTHHVSLLNPVGHLAFPGMRVYKARWYRE